MKIFSYTGKGLRESNEDYLVSRKLPDNSYLLLLADGMGGYSCGADAAKIVADCIVNVFESAPSVSIDSAIESANLALYEFKEKKSIDNTGCTIAGAIITDDNAEIFWAGDSRVYVARKGKILFQTEDHSLVNEMKKVRVLTPEQIAKYEHIVRRAIMGDLSDKVQIENFALTTGDEILVCSDGLYKDMPEELVLMKLRQDGDRFCLDGEKFDDNHSLIYAII